MAAAGGSRPGGSAASAATGQSGPSVTGLGRTRSAGWQRYRRTCSTGPTVRRCHPAPEPTATSRPPPQAHYRPGDGAGSRAASRSPSPSATAAAVGVRPHGASVCHSPSWGACACTIASAAPAPRWCSSSTASRRPASSRGRPRRGSPRALPLDRARPPRSRPLRRPARRGALRRARPRRRRGRAGNPPRPARDPARRPLVQRGDRRDTWHSPGSVSGAPPPPMVA